MKLERIVVFLAPCRGTTFRPKGDLCFDEHWCAAGLGIMLIVPSAKADGKGYRFE